MAKKEEFDDLVLMQFADNELDSITREKLEIALLKDAKLRERLEPFIHSKVDLEFQKNGVPDNIEIIIQSNKSNQAKTKRFNLFDFLFGNSNVAFGGVLQARPIVAMVITFAIGGVIGLSSNFGINTQTIQSQSPSSMLLSPMSDTKTRGLDKQNKKPNKVVIDIIKNLSKNPNIKSFITPEGEVNIINSFKGEGNIDCRIAALNGNYYVACKDSDGKWSIKN